MPAGRPPIYSDPEEVTRLMSGYFQQFDDPEGQKAKKAPNLFGLCRYLSISYDAFIDYENGQQGEELSVPFKDARLRCLEYAGEHVYTHTAGAVFAHVNLTKKFKEPWKNAQAQEITGANNGPVKVEITGTQAGIL